MEIRIRSVFGTENYGQFTVSRVPCLGEWVIVARNDYEVSRVVHELDYLSENDVVATIYIRD